MGEGFAGVERASADVAARRAQGGIFLPRFRLEPDESATVRFLEQGEEVKWAWVSQLPPKPGRSFGNFEPTRDQAGDGSTPCPLAERGLPRQFRGWINLIWRNGPVYARDAEGKMRRDGSNKPVIESRADGVFVWEAGIMVFEELATLDRAYKGLSSRDFKVTRRGAGTSTRYGIMPAEVDGGAKPMSAADQALAKDKPDLTPYVTPKEYDELVRLLTGQAPSAGGPGPGFNPFMDN